MLIITKPVHSFTSVIITCLALVTSRAYADVKVLERFIGHWNNHVEILKPEHKIFSYQESYQWVLDGKFIRGENKGKPDNTRDIIFGTYDANSDGYPFWVFSSSGSFLYLFPATWHPNENMMEWENPRGLDIIYHSRCYFPDRNNRHCSLIMKDWKGKVIQEMKWRAVRRKD